MRKGKETLKLSPDTIAKDFWTKDERFADLFNAFAYHAERLRPEDLRELDTDLSTLIADKDLLETIKKVRDVVKIASDGTRYQILAIENQQEIHYAMALRCQLYDVLTYYQQMKKIVEKNKKEKSLNSSAEFLSGFRKSDKLIPCRTIVIYYGEDEWDGAQNLSELMEFAREEDSVAFNEYHYELICLNKLNVSEYEFREKSVRDFLLWISSFYQSEGEKMPEELSDMEAEVAYAVATVTGTLDKYKEILKDNMESEKETVNMSKILDNLLEKRWNEGIEEGEAKGELKNAQKVALKMLQADRPMSEIMEFTDLSEEEIVALKNQ